MPTDSWLQEHHHWDTAAATMALPSCEVLDGQSPEVQAWVLESARAAVLATDMANHHSMVEQLGRHSTGEFDPELTTDRVLLQVVRDGISAVGNTV